MESAAYDEMRQIEDHHWWFRGRRRMVRPFLGGGQDRDEPATVVEIGCGTGGNFELLRERFAGARILGIDLDPGGLAYCRDRGLDGRVLRGYS